MREVENDCVERRLRRGQYWGDGRTERSTRAGDRFPEPNFLVGSFLDPQGVIS
jgi:hypothetical protein